MLTPEMTMAFINATYFKGDALPNPDVKDYKVDDPRRRVVLLFWSIFPD